MIRVKSIGDKLKRFKEDLQKGLVDELIIDIIMTLNNDSNLKTTSSCSGRIVLLCFNELERKYASKRLSFHFMPPRSLFLDTLARILKHCEGLILIRVRGFIVDIETRISDTIRSLLRKLSFKTAIIKPTKNHKRIIIELRSSIILDIPLLNPPNEKIYYIVTRYLWRNLIDLNIFRNILWYTISSGNPSDEEATLK